MTAVAEEKAEKGAGKAKSEGRNDEQLCRFWGTDEGCRKGQDHDWGGLEKKGRCFGCSGTGHSKKDCPTVRPKMKESPEKQAVKAVKEKVTTIQAKGDPGDGGPKTGGSEPVEHSQSSEGDKGAGTSGEMKDLLNEATTLLKSLRPSSSMKAIRLSSLEVREGGRALLDGGATHCLRRTSSEEEWASAQEVSVELAAGSAVLRLLPWTRTLLTKEDLQVIVPLGVLISLGYEAVWEKTRFELTDPTGLVLDTKVGNSCPTIDEALAHELIQEIERSMVRERARLAHLAGEDIGLEVDPEGARHLTELKELFPEVPHHILERLLPKKGWTGEGLPWNRHERRRLRRAKEVAIHLFGGDSKKFWQRELEAESRAILCIDTVIDQGMNLLRDDIFSYLLDLADGGTVCALLGGPPCRTMSRLRFKQPGPPPLREREGPYRFGLPQLDRYLRKQVEDDTVLFLRQLTVSSPSRSTGSRPEGDPVGIGTARGLMEVSFDQGPMGHSRRKPTRLGTNIPNLAELQDIRGHGQGGDAALAEDLTERIKQSRDWSAWAPGLKQALAVAIREALNSPVHQVKRMDLDAWKRHLLNGHLPYNRECKSCVIAASRGKTHKRIPHAEAYTLSIDTAGPFMLADDQLGKGRFVLVGVYLVPVTKDGQSLIPIHEEDELLGAEGGPELTVVDEGGADIDPQNPWPGLDDEKKWASMVEAEQDFQVKQVTFAEVMENRGAPAVLEAVGRMVAKLNFLGLPLKRLHSDRAGEYQSKTFDKWVRDRGLCRTFTDGDNFKGNGRAEGAVAQLKRGARTLLVAAGLDESYWCHASRHWAETRLRSQLESMGWKRRQLATFGQVVWAKRKLYSDRQKYLSTTRTQVSGGRNPLVLAL